MLVCDTHIHSYRSFVGNPNMTFSNIASQSTELGINVVAVTDHLMKPEDVDDLRTTRRDILNFRVKGHKSCILFGVEVCEIAADGSTLLDKVLTEEMCFEVVIGGVHETHMPHSASLGNVAIMQHRHHLIMMENPLIDILAHPWWLDKSEFESLCIEWPTDMSFIPETLTVELAKASRSTNTYIEISTMSGLCNKDTSPKFKKDLLEYYRLLNREGALFAIGTDTHELSEMSTFSTASDLIKAIGINEDRMWQPKSNIFRIGGNEK